MAVVLVQTAWAAAAVGQTEEPIDVENWVCCPCERLAAYTGDLAGAAMGMQYGMESAPEALNEAQEAAMSFIVYTLSKGMGFAAGRLAACLEEENQPYYDAGAAEAEI